MKRDDTLIFGFFFATVAFSVLVFSAKGCDETYQLRVIDKQAIEAGYQQVVVEGQVVWRKSVDEVKNE